MTPEVFMMAGLALMWVAAVCLLVLVCVLYRRTSHVEQRLQAVQQTMQLRERGDEQAWAAVTDAFRDTHTDMEVKPS